MVKIFLNMELLYLIMVVKGEPRLVILRSANSSRTEVPAVVVVTKGEDLILICETWGNEDGTDFRAKNTNEPKYLNNYTCWTVGAKSTKNGLSNTDEPSKLSFTPVIVDNQGTYFCTSLIYNLTKTVTVIVRLEKPRALKPNVEQKNLDRSYYKSENPKTVISSFGPLFYIVAIATISLVIFILYIVYQQARHAEDAPAADQTCGHPICTRVRNSNPASGCILGSIISNNRPNDRIVSVSSFMNPLVDANDYAVDLDLPPSYGTSMRNDMPPSYDEALATIATQYCVRASSPPSTAHAGSTTN